MNIVLIAVINNEYKLLNLTEHLPKMIYVYFLFLSTK